MTSTDNPLQRLFNIKTMTAVWTFYIILHASSLRLPDTLAVGGHQIILSLALSHETSIIWKDNAGYWRRLLEMVIMHGYSLYSARKLPNRGYNSLYRL